MCTSVHICIRMYIYTYVAAQFGLVGRQEMSINKVRVMEQKLQHSATHCKKLQQTATHCNTLEQTETHTSPSWVGRSCSFPIQTSAETGKVEGFTTIAITRGLFLILSFVSSGCPFSSTKVHTT